MSYLVLARKYRPRVFADMVGQEVVTATLRGAIEENRVGHAYLFTGPRGTGKTTTARILAKALNCERGPTPEPCGECERCQACDSGTEIDVMEIDAASNTGVDHVRELRDQAAYLPLRARFKIYIIDEVHMLSKQAFNALLKTLEEPPPHVKFFFATTELEKVLETVLSRCQVLRLVPLSERTIAERLAWVFARENVRAEPGVGEALARRARGGMRDALSLADQLLSLAGDAPRLCDVESLSAAAGAEAYERVFDALEAASRADVLASLPPSAGTEAEFLSGLLDHLRATLLVGVCGEDVALVDLAPAERVRARERARRLGLERIERWLEELLMARERMRELPQHARLALEVALLDLARPESTLGLAEIAERLEALEGRLGSAAPAAPRGAALPPSSAPASGGLPATSAPILARSVLPAAAASAPSTPGANAAASAPAPRTPAAAAAPAPAPTVAPTGPARQAAAAGLDLQTLWNRFLEELAAHSDSLAETLRRAGRLGEIGERRALVRVTSLREDERLLFQSPRSSKACAQILSRLVGRELEFALEEGGAPQRKPKDPFTGKVQELFGGRVEEEA